MALREIIEIDESLCDGCGACETGCPEGALRVIEGKARLVGESLCDGLGACIGGCPRGAITITKREAEEYDEAKVMSGIVKHGPKVVKAHLEHLEHHGQDLYLRQAREYLAKAGISLEAEPSQGGCGGGCPGSASRRFAPAQAARAFVMPSAESPRAALSRDGTISDPTDEGSALTHWPIQLHLINPRAPQYAGAELLIAADCTAFSLGGFHGRILAGKSLVIACPKLDQGRDIYIDKLATLLSAARSVTVAIMEVPCCSGLLKLVMEARERLAAQRGATEGSYAGPAIHSLVLSIEGGIKSSRDY